MVRTYRSSKIWLWFFVLLPLGCLISAPFIVAGPALLVGAVVAGSHDTPRWFDLLFASFFLFFSAGAARWVYGAFDVCHADVVLTHQRVTDAVGGLSDVRAAHHIGG